jgi:hypothetical protein
MPGWVRNAISGAPALSPTPARSRNRSRNTSAVEDSLNASTSPPAHFVSDYTGAPVQLPPLPLPLAAHSTYRVQFSPALSPNKALVVLPHSQQHSQQQQQQPQQPQTQTQSHVQPLKQNVFVDSGSDDSDSDDDGADDDKEASFLFSPSSSQTSNNSNIDGGSGSSAAATAANLEPQLAAAAANTTNNTTNNNTTNKQAAAVATRTERSVVWWLTQTLGLPIPHDKHYQLLLSAEERKGSKKCDLFADGVLLGTAVQRLERLSGTNANTSAAGKAGKAGAGSSNGLVGFTAKPVTATQRLQNVRKSLECLAERNKKLTLRSLSCEEGVLQGDLVQTLQLLNAMRLAYPYFKR